jgi:hypothetical protein
MVSLAGFVTPAADTLFRNTSDAPALAMRAFDLSRLPIRFSSDHTRQVHPAVDLRYSPFLVDSAADYLMTDMEFSP